MQVIQQAETRWEGRPELLQGRVELVAGSFFKAGIVSNPVEQQHIDFQSCKATAY